MDHGRSSPAPATEVAYARAVVDALAREDWSDYTNLLATRADMIGVFAEHDRDTRRKRRDRRRLVWRRVNKLRGEGAERGWKSTRHEARMRSLPWGEVTIVDVWRSDSDDRRLPPDTVAARLVVELEHAGTTHWLDLRTCVQVQRGWVTLHPMALLERAPRSKGTSLVRGDAAAAPEPTEHP